MKFSIKSADLQRMTEEEQDEAFRKLFHAARTSDPAEDLRELNQQLSELEQRYGISSEDLRREISAGRRQESLEDCKWLILLDLRDSLESRPPRPG